jgi:hypothetical protein
MASYDFRKEAVFGLILQVLAERKQALFLVVVEEMGQKFYSKLSRV